MAAPGGPEPPRDKYVEMISDDYVFVKNLKGHTSCLARVMGEARNVFKRITLRKLLMSEWEKN